MDKKEVKDSWGNVKYTVEKDIWGNEKVYEGGGLFGRGPQVGSQRTDIFGTTTVRDNADKKVADDSGWFKDGLNVHDYDRARASNQARAAPAASHPGTQSSGYPGSYGRGTWGGYGASSRNGSPKTIAKVLVWLLVIFVIAPIVLFSAILALGNASLDREDAARTPGLQNFEPGIRYKVEVPLGISSADDWRHGTSLRSSGYGTYLTARASLIPQPTYFVADWDSQKESEQTYMITFADDKFLWSNPATRRDIISAAVAACFPENTIQNLDITGKRIVTDYVPIEGDRLEARLWVENTDLEGRILGVYLTDGEPRHITGLLFQIGRTWE